MATIPRDYPSIQLFAPSDPYYWSIDNRPLWVMMRAMSALDDEVLDILDSHEECATFFIETPATGAIGGLFRSELGGTIARVTLSNTTAGASSDTIADVNINGTTAFTTQSNRPTLAFDDADRVVTVQEASIENKTVPAGGLISVDLDQLQTGSPLKVRVDVFIRRDITARSYMDYILSGDPLEITYSP